MDARIAFAFFNCVHLHHSQGGSGVFGVLYCLYLYPYLNEMTLQLRRGVLMVTFRGVRERRHKTKT